MAAVAVGTAATLVLTLVKGLPAGGAVVTHPRPDVPVLRSWPMFGGSPARNMVNLAEKGLPTAWSVEAGKFRNVKWVAELGRRSYGGLVVAGGRVFVGTNNGNSGDRNVKPHQAVVMAFDEPTGKFLWQRAHDTPDEETFRDTSNLGLFSTPAVVGDRLYYVTPACEVVCARAADGKVTWTYDLRKALKVTPLHCNNCSPLVIGGRVFVVTGHGVDHNTGKVVNPQAPSFVALDAGTGRLLWQSNLPGDRIIEGQWSNPAYAEAGGQGQVIFPGGDGWLYSFEPATGKLRWRFNCHPQLPANLRGTPNYFIATPVVHAGRLYIGMGSHQEHHNPMPYSHFFCIDITKRGDVSPQSLHSGDAANRGSALLWAFGGPIEPRPKKGRSAYFGRTVSTAAVHDGLVYISEETGYLHCLDAATGRRYWEHDLKTAVWGSPSWTDGKVYLGTEDGEVLVFAHGREPKLLAKVDMEEPIVSTPVAANGVLFVMTRTKLYAIGPR